MAYLANRQHHCVVYPKGLGNGGCKSYYGGSIPLTELVITAKRRK
ncbi:MAG: hypothetical protein PHV20_10570 [Bacteroidales bacterium]|nr:hypothetical protein [Bacteroidales bacterium]